MTAPTDTTAPQPDFSSFASVHYLNSTGTDLVTYARNSEYKPGLFHRLACKIVGLYRHNGQHYADVVPSGYRHFRVVRLDPPAATTPLVA